jgi:hypothetical protein
VHAVEEAIGVDAIENVPMPSQRQLEGLECISTQDLSLTQLQIDLEATPLKCFTSQASLSLDGILCTMHSINPTPPTEVCLGSSEGPWFRRTSALTLGNGHPGCTTSMLDVGSARKDGNTSKSDAGVVAIRKPRSARVESLITTPPCSILSEVGEIYSWKPRANKNYILQEDKALDDALSKTQRCDGR